MAQEYRLKISKDAANRYELFVNEDNTIEPNIYPIANIDEHIAVVGFFAKAVAYLKEISADEIKIQKLAPSELPNEFSLEMKRSAVVFRAGKWATDNTFELTTIETGIPTGDFQDNNIIDKRIILGFRKFGFDFLEIEKLI